MSISLGFMSRKTNRYRSLFCALALLGVTGSIFAIRSRMAPEFMDRIRVGDTKLTVVSEVGKPAGVFTNDLISLKYGGEVWAYGKKFDARVALRGDWPFKLRLFVPDTGDYLVVFDTSGAVRTIESPHK